LQRIGDRCAQADQNQDCGEDSNCFHWGLLRVAVIISPRRDAAGARRISTRKSIAAVLGNCPALRLSHCRLMP
jgi:hypothetical protein